MRFSIFDFRFWIVRASPVGTAECSSALQCRAAYVVAIVALSLALAGCMKEKEPEQPANPPAGGNKTTAAPAKKFLVGMSQCTETEPWRVQMDTDIKDAATKHPNEIELKMANAQDKSETQQSDVRQFIQQKVDLI